MEREIFYVPKKNIHSFSLNFSIQMEFYLIFIVEMKFSSSVLIIFYRVTAPISPSHTLLRLCIKQMMKYSATFRCFFNSMCVHM